MSAAQFIDPETAIRRVARNWQAAEKSREYADSIAARQYEIRADAIAQTWGEVRNLSWADARKELAEYSERGKS